MTSPRPRYRPSLLGPVGRNAPVALRPALPRRWPGAALVPDRPGMTGATLALSASPAQVLQSLSHPNIVSCVESFIHQGKVGPGRRRRSRRACTGCKAPPVRSRPPRRPAAVHRDGLLRERRHVHGAQEAQRPAAPGGDHPRLVRASVPGREARARPQDPPPRP